MDIYWLNQITSLERSLVGEKAFALSQLLQNKYPVQPGFVISAATLQEFLKTLEGSEVMLSDFPYAPLHLDIDNYQVLQTVAQQSRQEILVTPLPEQWLSKLMSAAQSLPSSTLILRASPQLSNFLGQSITGLLPAQIARCEPEALGRALKQIWSELFSAHSLFFWQRLGMSLEKLHLAVLVQPIYNAIASGTLAIQPARIQIQATRGLGHSLVKGEVLPDLYTLDLTTGKMQWHLGNQVLAYRLRILEAGDGQNSCLETYILEDKEQEQFALSQADVNNLMELSKQLAFEQPVQAFLEWTITASLRHSQARERAISKAEEISSQLYLTQLDLNQQSTAQKVEHPQAPQTSELLLTGVAASPGQAIALAYLLSQPAAPLQAIPDGSIIVTPTLAPNWLSLLKRAAGVVIEQGGLTSHAAIIARELGIPAVVGATKATQLIETGESILLDGGSGEVYRLRQEKVEVASKPKSDSPSSSQFLVPLATQLLVNLSQPSAIAQANAWPIDGIGVLQSESILSSDLVAKGKKDSHQLLLIEQLTEYLSQFAAAFTPRSVFYRISDWPIPNFDCGRQSSASPAFSRRATLSRMEHPGNSGRRGTDDRLLPQLQLDKTLLVELKSVAHVRAIGYTNVHVLLPGVRSVEEFTFFYRCAEAAGLVEQDSFQLWLIIDVPSVSSWLPRYVQAGVQGIAIEAERLLPLLLNISNPSAPMDFNALHPARLAPLKQLIKQANQVGISSLVSIQAAVEYPNLIDWLVEWGVTAISVAPLVVEATYWAIARAEQRLLIKAARQQLHPLP